MHIIHLHGLELEVKAFQEELKKAFEEDDNLNFSYKTKIKQKVQEFELDENDYIDVIEDNQFTVEEWNKFYK